MLENIGLMTRSSQLPVPFTQAQITHLTLRMDIRERTQYLYILQGRSNKCSAVTDPKERLAIVRQDGLCFNCLAQHKVSCCSSRFTCREGKKQHHTSLCQSFPTAEIPSQNVPEQSPTSKKQQALTTMVSASLSPTYTTVCLLKTAIAQQVSLPIVTTEGNILFDKGAQ